MMMPDRRVHYYLQRPFQIRSNALWPVQCTGNFSEDHGNDFGRVRVAECICVS